MRVRPGRRAVAAALGAALVLGALTGCTFITPQATTVHYDASDGIGATVGDLQVRNALLLTADGTTGSLLINLDNPTKYGVQVKVQYENADKAKVDDTVYVNAGSVASFGGQDSDRILLTGIDAPAGSLFPVFIQYGDVTGKQLWVPVLDGSMSQYAPLVP
ncbi:hypothetical protein GCM10022239_07790 [Leifsonia bigeumensis]|uniref:DNA modification methylase n=1 Tax=Leifsonella bigeumensis TaxID=433643 RepID=A0ABP7FET6_9MICO